MTIIGHTIAGATIAVLAVPAGTTRRRLLAVVGVFAFLANFPDLPVPGWGHDRYDISHSIFVIGALLTLAVTLAFLSEGFTAWSGGRRIIIAGSLACLSHLLLDTFYNHGLGLRMFWPVSNRGFSLAIACFDVLQTSLPKITMHSLRVFAIELACYGPIFVAAVVFRRRTFGRLESLDED